MILMPEPYGGYAKKGSEVSTWIVFGRRKGVFGNDGLRATRAEEFLDDG
jgi:hypothetical protein